MNRIFRSIQICIVGGLAVFVQINAHAIYRDFGEVVHQKNSLYTSIYVYQSDSIMTLQFGKQQATTVESQVDVDNPREHMLEYSAMSFCGLLYNPEPKNMLVLGLGGGVIPREMRHYYPSLKIDIAEIDRDIQPIATKYFGFKPDENMQVHERDGRVYVKRQLRLDPVPKYDLIVLDAFNGDYIPFHLMTKEFLEELKGVLSDKGVVVANVFSSNRLFDAEFKTFVDVFGRSQVFYGVSSGNAMIVSPAPEVPLLTASDAVSKATELQEELELSFDYVRVARMLAPDAKPDARAKTLTDDQAPVNVLRSQRTQAAIP